MFFEFLQCTLSSLSCKNLNNKDVSWWAAFKMPPTNDGKQIDKDGYGYYYYDKDNTFVESPGGLNSQSDNAVYYTISHIYDNSDIGYILLNDQTTDDDIPNLTSDSCGHMKGVVLFDSDDLVYIEHSVPKFPMGRPYSYPDTGTNNAQSFLCLTLSSSKLEDISKSWLISRPNIYDSSIPSYAYSLAPSLESVINKKWNTQDTTSKTSFSVGGNSITLFTKSKSWGKDIYHDLIAQELGVDLYAETWCKGASYLNLDSDCSGNMPLIISMN